MGENSLLRSVLALPSLGLAVLAALLLTGVCQACRNLQKLTEACGNLGEAGASEFPSGVGFLRGRERGAILNVHINVFNPVKTAGRFHKSL